MSNKTFLYSIGGIIIGVFLATVYYGSTFNEHNPTVPISVTAHDGRDHTMEGTMDSMTVALQGKTGDAFDKAFLSEMIVHHEGAVIMAELVLKNSKRPELIKLANDIISAQTKEIQVMKGWQKEWFLNR